MDKQKKQSVIPIYAVGLVWLSRAISGNLSSFGQIIKTVILSVVTYGVLRIFFPDKIKQADPEKPAQQPDAPKQAQTQKTQPQPQPEEKKQDEPSTGRLRKFNRSTTRFPISSSPRRSSRLKF